MEENTLNKNPELPAILHVLSDNACNLFMIDMIQEDGCFIEIKSGTNPYICLKIGNHTSLQMYAASEAYNIFYYSKFEKIVKTGKSEIINSVFGIYSVSSISGKPCILRSLL